MFSLFSLGSHNIKVYIWKISIIVEWHQGAFRQLYCLGSPLPQPSLWCLWYHSLVCETTKATTILYGPYPQPLTKGEQVSDLHLQKFHTGLHNMSIPEIPWVLQAECVSTTGEEESVTPVQSMWAPKPDQSSLSACQTDVWALHSHMCVITGHSHNNREK